MKFFSVLAITLFLMLPIVSQGQTFVETCLGDTKILYGQLTCRIDLADGVSTLQFVLTRGEKLRVEGSGYFGKFSNSYSIFKIVHLPPRTTDLGVMNESVQFQADAGHKELAVVTIPCHQSEVVTMGKGLSKIKNTPDERVAHCSVK